MENNDTAIGHRHERQIPCVFFDRDGVVNESPGEGYVLSWEQFRFQDGILNVLKEVKDRGYLAVLITSQRCVGKGLISEPELGRIHQALQEGLGELAFDGIRAFTGLPGTESWEKPRPEMILDAAEEYAIDLGRSWMIGDADRDIEMAQCAGVGKTVRLVGDKPIGNEADFTVQDLSEVLDVLQSHLSRTSEL